MIRKIISRLKLFKIRKHVRNNAILMGNNYEFGENTIIALRYGSTQDDIILHDNISLLGCSLVSQCHGKIELGDYVKLGAKSRIDAVESVTIGDYTRIAVNTIITDNNSHPVNPLFRKFMATTSHESDARCWKYSAHKPVIIGKNCWIGQNVRIQKGVSIGDNSVVAANSVVTKSIPENCIAAGNPAKIVKENIQEIPSPKDCEAFNIWLKEQNK